MMKCTFRNSVLALICTFYITFPVLAQETDRGMWSSFELKKKFKGGIALSLEEEYRLREDFQTTDKFMTTLDLSWKPFSFLKGGIAYCRIDYNHPSNNTHTDEYWELRHRYSAYLTGDYDLGRFGVSLREKFQQTKRVGVVADADKSNPTNVLRSRLQLTYDWKSLPLKPYISGEVFYTLNEPDGEQDPSATKMVTEDRYAAGLEYDISKRLTLAIGYLYSSSTGWDDDVRNADGDKVGGYVDSFEHILTTGLTFTF
jgi:hypothetical protein